MEAFHWTDFDNFQDLITGFAEPIQRDLYCLIVNTDKCPFQLRLLALMQMELFLDKKEAYLSDTLREPLKKYQLKTLLRNLSFFPKSIQDKCYVQIAESDYPQKVRLGALQLLE